VRTRNGRSRRVARRSAAAVLLASLAACGVVLALFLRQERLDAALIQAIKLRRNDAAIALLRQGANANAEDGRTSMKELAAALWAKMRGRPAPGQRRRSALLLACTLQTFPQDDLWRAEPADPSLVRALVSHGANPNYCRDALSDPTALECQIEGGDSEVVQLLLDYGANPNDPGGYFVPLGLAVTHDRVDVARLLFDHGANVREDLGGGETPLHRAAGPVEDSAEMLGLLLSRGADINARDEDGRTPLMVAADVGSPAATFLLRRGADPSIKDKKGETALDRARKLRASPDRAAVIALLKRYERAARPKGRSRTLRRGPR
jgi:ankyrin repeat protein